LIVVRPVYAGDEVGYTSDQAVAFSAMDAVASRAVDEGMSVLRDMYFSQLPASIAERAWQIASAFDPESVVATSRFIVSGAQPFGSVEELRSIRLPTLLVRGDDAMHPSEISDLYAGSIHNCTVVPPDGDVVQAIRGFLEAAIAA
jgi:hypothetical protein